MRLSGPRASYQTKFGGAAWFWSKMLGKWMCPTDGEAMVCGLFVVTDDRTGLAVGSEPVWQGKSYRRLFQDEVCWFRLE